MNEPLDVDPDLHRLLQAPGVGPKVLQRLEQVGVRSLAELMRRGVEPTVAAICAETGHRGWANRRDALVRALTDAARRSIG
jgi:nucleotidyltransferase/DNA polymerase involved in DNA repair